MTDLKCNLMEGLPGHLLVGRALARWASDPEKLLARPQNLLVPDDQTGLLSSPASSH